MSDDERRKLEEELADLLRDAMADYLAGRETTPATVARRKQLLKLLGLTPPPHPNG